ncbi:MAG: ArnT family glycosyltransferase [Anaerolineae bacterium]
MKTEGEDVGGHRIRAWESILLLAILVLGLWFRWRYAVDVSFFVDEYLTARAAEKILAQGVPILPSGNFYSHGLLLSYIEALVIGLGGTQQLVMRLPVIVMSIASILLTWWFGRKTVSPIAGLVAAALLAMAPEAILWGGRVRMYAPLQFFVLLATIIFYFWVVLERDRPLYRMGFVAVYWCALLSHAETALLLPLWGAWVLIQRGWRWLLRPANLLTFLLSGLSVVIEALLRQIGPPVQARVAPGVLEPLTRQYLGIAFDAPGAQKALAPVFLTPTRLPLTFLLAIGIIYLLLTALSSKKHIRVQMSQERKALSYLYALLLPALALLLFAIDPEWKSPRYSLMLLPHVFLIAAGVLVWLGRWIQSHLARMAGRRRATLGAWVGAIATVILIGLTSWPSALAATRESVPRYDRAFTYVREHQQPDDIVITFLCPAAFWHLGRCDYLAIPTDFSGFAFQKDGRWVSGWDGVPILDSATGLQQAFDKARCAWFVVDEGRFATRYDAEFQQAVQEGMELVAAEHEVLVFHWCNTP